MHKVLTIITLYYKRPYKALPSTSVYNRGCTKHFPVLLCTRKVAQSTSQSFFVLQSLRKTLPSSALYNKAATNTSQHTTLCNKACTKYFPVLQKELAQSIPKYTKFVLPYKTCTKFFAHSKQAFIQRSSYTESFYTEKPYTEKLFRGDTFLHREDFTQRHFHIEKLLRTATLPTTRSHPEIVMYYTYCYVMYFIAFGKPAGHQSGGSGGPKGSWCAL